MGCVFSFMRRPLNSRGKSQGAYPLTNKMGGAQRRYRILKREKCILSLLGIVSQLPEYSVHSSAAITTQQIRLTAKTLTPAYMKLDIYKLNKATITHGTTMTTICNAAF
jgi:hypothetical protein